MFCIGPFTDPLAPSDACSAERTNLSVVNLVADVAALGALAMLHFQLTPLTIPPPGRRRPGGSLLSTIASRRSCTMASAATRSAASGGLERVSPALQKKSASHKRQSATSQPNLSTRGSLHQRGLSGSIHESEALAAPSHVPPCPQATDAPPGFVPSYIVQLYNSLSFSERGIGAEPTQSSVSKSGGTPAAAAGSGRGCGAACRNGSHEARDPLVCSPLGSHSPGHAAPRDVMESCAHTTSIVELAPRTFHVATDSSSETSLGLE